MGFWQESGQVCSSYIRVGFTSFKFSYTLFPVNQSYSSFHLHFDKLVSRGPPSHPQISGTSEGPGPVNLLRCVYVLDE